MSPADISRGDVVETSDDASDSGSAHRTWLVLSDPALHRSRRLFIAVPLTHTDRGWGTHVVLDPDNDTDTARVAVCEQIRALSTQRVTRVDRCPYPIEKVDEVHQVVVLLTSAR